MKKYILGSLIFLSFSAFADWVSVGQTDEARIYMNADNSNRRGNIVSTWVLRDFKKKQSFGNIMFSSGIVQMEYNCEEIKSRSLKTAIYSAPKGRGSVLADVPTVTEFTSITPGSASDAERKFACEKVS